MYNPSLGTTQQTGTGPVTSTTPTQNTVTATLESDDFEETGSYHYLNST